MRVCALKKESTFSSILDATSIIPIYVSCEPSPGTGSLPWNQSPAAATGTGPLGSFTHPSVLVCVELGLGPKFEPNKFGGVGIYYIKVTSLRSINPVYARDIPREPNYLRGTVACAPKRDLAQPAARKVALVVGG